MDQNVSFLEKLKQASTLLFAKDRMSVHTITPSILNRIPDIKNIVYYITLHQLLIE